jgi:ribosomal protein S18 acetylase RimI-like enzyme
VPRLSESALPPDAVRAIEEVAMRAWPACLVEPLHGWRLAFGDGLTRRINSVQPVAWDDRGVLDGALRRVEDFYAERGLPARFRLTAVSRPEGLDSHLAGRGYEIEAPTDVLVTDASQPRSGAMHHPVTIAEEAPPDWRELWLAQGSQDEVPSRQALLARLRPGTIFALAESESKPCGIGLAVIERNWAGIFAMHTAARFRGQGVARAVLGALMTQATAMGARRLYIQVEQTNGPAQHIYRRAGFGFAYSYHYRTSTAALPE